MAVVEDIGNAIVSELQGLTDLAAITDANIVLLKVITNKQQHLPATPGIAVAPFGRKVTTPVTNLRDDITYPFLVALLRAGNQNQTANLTSHGDQQETIEAHFRHQRLTGVASVHTCVIPSSTTFDIPAWLSNYDAAFVQLNFISREERGAT